MLTYATPTRPHLPKKEKFFCQREEEYLTEFLIMLVAINVIMTLFGLKLTIEGYIQLQAMKESTHQVTWAPWSPEDDKKLKEATQTLPNKFSANTDDFTNDILENNF